MDARIDVVLAPLIKRLWQCGIFTSNCCQENRPAIAWIEFQRPYDALEFLNLVAPIPTKKELKSYQFWDKLYGRMTHPGQFGEWEYSCHVRNKGEDFGEADFDFSISIRFPQTDLPAIMKAIKAKRGDLSLFDGVK